MSEDHEKKHVFRYDEHYAYIKFAIMVFTSAYSTFDEHDL